MSEPASLLDVVRRAVDDFRAIGARAALVGGLAVGVHVLERSTRDADFAVAVTDDAEAERVTGELVARGYVVALVLEETALGRLSTVRLVSPVDHRTMVDILYASSGVEPELVEAAMTMDVGRGVLAPVAHRGHLVALKLLSESERRPQDAGDLGALLTGIDDVELDRARAAIALIAGRGFARGKDLPAQLAAHLLRWTDRR